MDTFKWVWNTRKISETIKWKVSYTGNVVSLTINLLWMWWWFCIWFVLFILFINCAFINLEDSYFYAIYLSCPTCIMCKSCHIVCWSYPILYLVKNKIVILYQWILSNYSKFPFLHSFPRCPEALYFWRWSDSWGQLHAYAGS